jgi:KDO2-lipid IV(A) lauroyltransferase
MPLRPITTWLVIATLTLLSRLPFAVRRGLARGFARLAAASPATRQVPLVNLHLCMGPMPSEQLRALLLATLREEYLAGLDAMRWWSMDERRLRRAVTLHGADILHRERGRRPIVVVCPHMHAAEAGSQRLALECRFVALYRTAPDAVFDAWKRRARSRFNDTLLVPVDNALRPMVRALAEGLPLFLMPDFDAGQESPSFSPFFGIPTATGRTAAWCAARPGAAIIPFSVRRVAGDRIEARLHPPIEGLGQDIDTASALINRRLEALIREAPEQYAWSLPRFARRPDGAADLYADARQR